MAHLLKLRTVELHKQPLEGNGCVARNSGVAVRSDIFRMVLSEAV
jgi:hypothetical protein